MGKKDEIQLLKRYLVLLLAEQLHKLVSKTVGIFKFQSQLGSIE